MSGSHNGKRSTMFIRRKVLKGVFQLSDLVGMVFCFLVAFRFRHLLNGKGESEAIQTLAFWMEIENVILFLGFCFAWHASFYSAGLYRSKRFSSRRDELFDILKAVTFGTMVIFTMASLAKREYVHPGLLSFSGWRAVW